MGGYRLVRLLGSGMRSRVFLAHDGQRAVALKVFRPGATPESIDDEIAALSSASHAHIVSLREVGASPSGLPFLVLERLEATSVATLIASRSALGCGEAVTILAPVVAAVGALHSSGVAHGSIGAERVLFRATGAPVLAGLGRATLFVPPTSPVMLSTSRPVLEDRLALGRLVTAVASRVDHRGVPLTTWLASLERDGFPDGFTDLLLDRVFALGQASPVRFAAVPVAPSPQTDKPEPIADLSGVAHTRAVLARLRPAVLAVISRLMDSARTVRRPIWMAAGVGVSSLVAALFLVPPGESGEAVQPAATPLPTAQTSASPVVADDPAAAFAMLMTARARCIRDLSVLCLEAVDQAGSAALDDDAAVIRSIESGESTGLDLVLDETSIEIVERHGDAALLRYGTGADSEPASVLLVKGEAGWRIRDYLAG